MPKSSDHKTVQACILIYADEEEPGRTTLTPQGTWKALLRSFHPGKGQAKPGKFR